MARIDYFAIEQEIQTILKADPSLAGVNVLVEEDLSLSNDKQVGIYLERRDALIENQRISAGQTTHYTLFFLIVSRAYDLFSLPAVIEARDDLLGKVEIVLMKNRTLNDKVKQHWLEGGDMPTGKAPDNGYISEGEIILVAEVAATTT